jgi:hypothetical protein
VPLAVANGYWMEIQPTSGPPDQGETDMPQAPDDMQRRFDAPIALIALMLRGTLCL